MTATTGTERRTQERHGGRVRRGQVMLVASACIVAVHPCLSHAQQNSPYREIDAPIGIFDSGFGGLTVARAVIDQLPHESVLYLGDTARQPYGPKPIGEVREYALECLDHLVAHGVKVWSSPATPPARRCCATRASATTCPSSR